MIRFYAILLALVTLPVLAGCASNPGLPLTPLSEQVDHVTSNYTYAPPVAYDAQGHVLALPNASSLALGVEQMLPGYGAEPNIGVTSKGSLFVTTLDQVRRSQDHGKSWQVVEDLVTPQFPTTEDVYSTADPSLWVDPSTDRVFDAQMNPVLRCTWTSWSDQNGDPGSWTERPFDCGPLSAPYVTSVTLLDHQKIMTAPPGPKAPPLPLLTYKNLVYMCVNKNFDPTQGYGPKEATFGTTCSVSYDGGLTYAYETSAYPADRNCGNINGHPAAYPDGTVALVLGNIVPSCKRPLTIAMTEDNGLTWQVKQCDKSLAQFEIDADMTITPDGVAYVLYRDHDNLEHLLRSKDKFQTCQNFLVAPPGTTVNAFAGITSGDDGSLVMAYLGTKDRQVDSSGRQMYNTTPSNTTQGSIWQLYVTTTTNAESDNPTFVTQQVTPDQDPVQIGCIWQGGGGGGQFQCRNLLDFIDVVHDNDGRWYVSITDGCTPRSGCTGSPHIGPFQSKDSQVAVVVEDHGPSVFKAKGILPSLGLKPPQPIATETPYHPNATTQTWESPWRAAQGN